MLSQIRLRRDTAADWTSEDPTLLQAEIGIETDTKKFKIGDGTTAWTSLNYDYYVDSENIIPSASGSLDIGSTAYPFKDIYLTGSSLYMNERKVLYMSGANLVLDSPSGNVVISGGVDLSNADLSSANIQHHDLSGLADDDHSIYSLADGTRAFTGTIGGVTPAASAHLATKGYVDTVSGSLHHGDLVGLADDDHVQYALANGTRAFTGNVQANASGTLDIGAAATPFNDAFVETVNVGVGNAPATASGAGTQGTIVWDSDYIYVCIQTNVWKRASISTW